MTPGFRRISIANYVMAASLLAVTLIHLFLVAVGNPPFSPDSWTYLELSKTIDRDFYRFSTWRSFWEQEPYSTAMPPLWPTIIWIVNKAADLGIYAGFFANFIIFAAFAAVAEAIARESKAPAGTGFLSAFLLLTYPPYINEMVSGRAIPLSLLIIAAQIWLLVSGRDRRWQAPLFGFLLGLATLNRFDFLPIAVGGIILTAFLWRNWRFTALATAALALTLSPWMAYSVSVFGKFFATDNGIVAVSVDPRTFVTDYYPALPKTLFQDPVLWFEKILGNASAILATILTAWPQMILTYGVMIWAATALLFSRTPAPNHDSKGLNIQSPVTPRSLILLFGLVSLLPFAGYLATGYSDLRYLSPQIWLVGLLCVLILTMRGSGPRRRSSAFYVLLIISASLANLQLSKSTVTWPPQIGARAAHLAAVQPILHCLDTASAGPDATTLFVGDTTEAARFGAMTTRMTSMLPANWPRLTHSDRTAFFNDFNIGFIYFARRNVQSDAVERSYLRPIDGCETELYRLALPDADSLHGTKNLPDSTLAGGADPRREGIALGR